MFSNFRFDLQKLTTTALPTFVRLLQEQQNHYYIVLKVSSLTGWINAKFAVFKKRKINVITFTNIILSLFTTF